MAYDSATLTALASGQLVLRDFLTVDGLTLGGSAAQFIYWTGEDDIATNVVPYDGGTAESRSFVGGGTLLSVPEIVDAIGLEVRSFTFGLDHITDTAGHPLDMVFGNNVRVARVELHRGVFDPDTGNLASEPHLLLYGRVDGAEVDDAAAADEGGLNLEVVSSAIDLTKTNPAMESHAQQHVRDADDDFRKWGDTAAQVETWWGQAQAA